MRSTSPPASADPRAEYRVRLDAGVADLGLLNGRFRRVSNWRGGVALLGVLALWLVFGDAGISPYWLIAPAAAFIALMIRHELIVGAQARVQRRIRFYEEGRRRLDEEWMGRGSPGEPFSDPDHVYAADLDLFGKGSLFELLCIARTLGGQIELAAWLKGPASFAAASKRQEAVRELKSDVDLREEWALLGEDVQSYVHFGRLTEWGRRDTATLSSHARLALFVASAAGPILLLGTLLELVPSILVLVHFLVIGVLTAVLRKRTEAITDPLESKANDLELVSALAGRLERLHGSSALVRSLQERIRSDGAPASKRIRQLRRLVELLDSASNQFFALIAFWLLWTPQFAQAVEAWRERNGPHVGEWLQALSEMEALLSLANYAYEHPTAAFPELLPSGKTFEASDLCHPLIPAGRAAPNDVSLGDDLRLLIVSGSNMSGKSTLLRAVGLNTVLAWVGAPVRATRLRISPVSLGAAIRTVDSVQDGRSRFYAEIMRLRQISELAAGERPALFLLDELLSGTNSHDRRHGAELLLKGLLRRGAFGMVSTHDLALTQLADTLGPGVVNMHFRDWLENGQLHFDYKIQPGVVSRSNALELMRSIGLDV